MGHVKMMICMLSFITVHQLSVDCAQEVIPLLTECHLGVINRAVLFSAKLIEERC